MTWTAVYWALHETHQLISHVILTSEMSEGMVAVALSPKGLVGAGRRGQSGQKAFKHHDKINTLQT